MEERENRISCISLILAALVVFVAGVLLTIAFIVQQILAGTPVIDLCK